MFESNIMNHMYRVSELVEQDPESLRESLKNPFSPNTGNRDFRVLSRRQLPDARIFDDTTDRTLLAPDTFLKNKRQTKTRKGTNEFK
jgi:hypothetical protein